MSGFRWSVRTAQPLAVAFLQLATLGSFWAYLEPLGKVAGFDGRGAQTLIAAVLATQVVAGSVATFAVRRLPVVDGDGRPVGLISMSDIARHAARIHRSGVDREVVRTLAAVSTPRNGAAAPTDAVVRPLVAM